VGTFVQWLEELAPPDLAASWDNVGLQVGDPDRRVQKVMVSLDPSFAVVEEAIDRGCDLIVTHHPLIFKPLKKITSDNLVGRILLALIFNGISVISAHTNLDATKGGVNDTLATLLGLKHVQAVGETGADIDDSQPRGMARLGEFEPGKSLEDLCGFLKERLSIPHVRVVSGPDSGVIKKVLVCGGSGGTMLEVALKLGCDALISGDIKYHDAINARENNLTVLDVGHFGSEHVIVAELARYFESRIGERGGVEIIQAKGEVDPFAIV